MSLNPVQNEVLRVNDPVTNLNSKRDYIVLRGGSVNSWQQFPATNVNTNTIQITCNPPSRDIIVNRKVYLRAQFTLTFTGVGNPLLRMDVADAPRAYPLSQVINTLQMTINDDTLTLAPFNQYWPALLWYHNRMCQRREDYSMTPSMLDQSQNYSDIFGGIRSPLQGYRAGAPENDEPRAGFSGMTITNGNNTATVVMTITEPIFLSPLYFGSGNSSGLIGIENMAFTATLGNLQRLWSHDGVNGNSVTALTVAINSASLLFNYITPDTVSHIPRQLSYPYFNLVSYPTKGSLNVAPGGAFSQTMQNIQLASIPRRIYIFARMDDSLLQANNTGFLLSDSYCAFANSNPISLTWNNNQFLSQASVQDLYQMSVRNGVQMSWNQWNAQAPNGVNPNPNAVTTGVGSILCVDFGTDIGLSPLEAPGVLGQYQLQFTVNMINTNPTQTFIPTLYCVVVSEGAFNVINGSCNHKIGVLTHSDVLNSRLAPSITMNDLHNVYGGGIGDFFRSIVSGAEGAFKGIKKVLPVAEQILKVIPHPYAQRAAEGVRTVRNVVGGGTSGGILYEEGVEAGCGGARRKRVVKRKKKGGDMDGGKMMSRAMLRKRLAHL